MTATVINGGPLAIRPTFPALLVRCIGEARPTVQLIFLLRFVAGWSFSGAAIGPRFLTGALVWELAVLSVYLFNGVMDVVEDRLNHSTRPVAAGRLPRKFAAGACAAAGVLSFAGAVLLGGWYPLLVVASLALGYAYTAPPFCLKRYSAGAGLSVIAGGLLTFVAGATVDGPAPGWGPLWVFALAMSLWMGGVGALAKDFSDEYGDALAGRRTAVVVRGAAKVRRIVAVNAALIAAGLFAFAVRMPVLRPAAVTLVVGACAVGVLSLAPLRRPGRATRYAVTRMPYRAFMLTQHLAHVVVILTTVS